MGAESTPATSAHKERTHSPITRGIRDNKWTGQPLGCLVCAWPLLLAFQLGTLVAGILSNPQSKKLLGVVSVHNCSLRRPILSEADRAYAPTPSLDFSRP